MPFLLIVILYYPNYDQAPKIHLSDTPFDCLTQNLFSFPFLLQLLLRSFFQFLFLFLILWLRRRR